MRTRCRNNIRSGLAIWHVVAMLAWAVVIYWVLMIQFVSGPNGTHALCGPWGCGPPVESLVAYHGFWAVLIWPIAAILGIQLRNPIAQQLGRVLLVVGVLGTISILAWAAIAWIAPDWNWTDFVFASPKLPYIWQRALFVLATSIDMPVVQTAIAGLICHTAGRYRSKRSPTGLPQPLPEAAEESRASQ